jgi:hypothetical protein
MIKTGQHSCEEQVPVTVCWRPLPAVECERATCAGCRLLEIGASSGMAASVGRLLVGVASRTSSEALKTPSRAESRGALSIPGLLHNSISL